MNFLFVDRVTRLRRRESIECRLELSPNHPIFAVHFPSNPMFPASLLIEAFAQAGTILIETSLDFTRKAIPGYLRAAKFHRAVRPPATLELSMKVEQWSEDGALLEGRALQSGRVCAVCTMGLVTADLELFFGGPHAALYRSMYDHWLGEAVLEGFELHPLEHLHGVGAR